MLIFLIIIKFYNYIFTIKYTCNFIFFIIFFLVGLNNLPFTV